MKKLLVLPLTAILLFGMAGCAANKEVTPISTGSSENQVIAVESQSEAKADLNEGGTVAVSSENPSGSDAGDAGDKTAEDDSLAIPGTWQAASVVSSGDDSMAPAFYVQFTKTEICYGHMTDGQFVKEYSDKITRFDKTIDGHYLVQAESAKAGQYTFKTSESDTSIMEYYSTWADAEFADKYIGGSSISKCS